LRLNATCGTLRLADGQPVVVRAKRLGGLPTSRRKAVLKALAD
jgi:hypothetical protein